jgi:hypothetical protein
MAKKRAKKRAKKSRTLLAAAVAFAASPPGRKLLKQAKDYAARPETKQRAQRLVAQARSRGKARVEPGSASSVRASDAPAPTYGTPPQH